MGVRQSREKITDADRAVLTLKTQRRKLTNEQKRIEGLVAREFEVASDLVKKNQKQKALLALKRRKLHEQQLDRLAAWQLNVEQLLSNVEVARQQKQLFAALKAGNEAVKELQSQVKLEDVERLMEDTAESHDYQERMQEAMSRTLTPEEDASARADLQELEEQLQQSDALSDLADLPSVPKHAAVVQQPAAVAEDKEEAAAEAVQETAQREEPVAAQ